MDTILASAPGRAGIVGNPSDMYGGAVLSCSTQERAHCSLSVSDRLIVEAVGERQEIITEDDLRLQGDRLDIGKSVIRWFGIDPSTARFKISTWSEIPENAGLAGSTALLTCVFSCVAEYVGARFNSYEIAENSRRVEANIMGITCGFQDQYMAVFGGLNYMEFRGKESLRQLDSEPYATVESLDYLVTETPFIIAHTGIKRHSGQVHKSVRQRWLEGDPDVVCGYADVTDMARMAKRALIKQRWGDLGRLMNENHSVQQTLGASGDANDRLIDIARKNGALGAKLAGAGHGGTIVALTFDVDATVSALKTAGVERVYALLPVNGLAVGSGNRSANGLGVMAVADY